MHGFTALRCRNGGTETSWHVSVCGVMFQGCHDCLRCHVSGLSTEFAMASLFIPAPLHRAIAYNSQSFRSINVSIIWRQLGFHLNYSKQAGSSDSASQGRRYLIVHHKSQKESLLNEARSLIWTATGQQAVDSITVGKVASVRTSQAVRKITSY